MSAGAPAGRAVPGAGRDAPAPGQAGEAAARDRMLLLALLSGAFLFLSFALNWEIDHGSFEVRENSEVLRGLGTIEASIMALAVAAVVVVLPQSRRLFPFELRARHVAAAALGALAAVAVLTWDAGAFLNVLVQTFVLVFFSSPLIFGLMGIIYHRPVHLVISAMFTFFIAAGVRNPVGELPVLMLFGFFFLLFVETAETSIRSWGMYVGRRISGAHLAAFIGRYLASLAAFTTLAAILSALVLNLHLVVGALGLGAVADSLEVRGFYGPAAAAIVVLGFIAMARFWADRGCLAPWAARLRALRTRLGLRPAPCALRPEMR
ncbi:MAG: hypothetical protein FJ149_07600 [Euryarchaeota archaeon]|nr:hypothetical protein [Euryarchaeota archaeon]